MKGKQLWKVLALVTCLSVSVNLVSVVSASDLGEQSVNIETDANHAEDIEYNRLRSTNLSYGKSAITKISGNEVNVSGLTQCIHICDKVYMTLTLERKVNGSYVAYKTWDFSTLNDTNIYESMNVIVPSGYYYRVSGYHAAKDDGLKESTTTLTSGILIS